MSAVKHGFKSKNKVKSKKSVKKTRKELRREKRYEKKQKRATFHQKKKQQLGKFVLNPTGERNEQVEVKFGKKNVHEILQEEHEMEKRKQQKLETEMSRQRKKHLKEANCEEDKTIKKLEKQLKLKKRKGKNIPKSFAADGLDYLLDFCDEENRKIAVETEKQLLGIDLECEFQDDSAIATGQTVKENAKMFENSSNSSTLHSEASIDSNEEKEFSCDDENSNYSFSLGGDKNSEESEDGFIDEEDHIVCEEEKQCFESKKQKLRHTIQNPGSKKKRRVSNSEEFEDKIEHNGEDDEDDEGSRKLWQDIYGRTRDKDGNIIRSRYVPPAARAKSLEEDFQNIERLIKLKRQLKGALNKLTDRNMHTMSLQIDELFMTNSRNDMNEMLSKLLMKALVAPIMTPERLIMEHMMLIAVLHANVGTEVGAQFLLSLVKKINEKLGSPQEVENKELDNLILMISHLYNFKVFGSKLIYEILEKLTNEFSEKEIELILLILRSVGFALREDDPLALKDLILKLQQKATVIKSDNPRVKFMLDVLSAIKNNNMNKIPQYDFSTLEHFKKLLKTLIRKGNGISQLNITLEDLLQVDERGKWWIVGAAWSGSATLEKKEKKEKKDEIEPKYSQKLLELARKQRMNTDARRNIFCILMSAEDFLDAFEKLHHLGLKDRQEKEIIHVLMNCCLQENTFNPYYAVLAQKFCDYDRKYQMTIQYTLWDKLKILDNFTNKQLMNLAQFLIHLFMRRGLSISTMKVVQLDELDKPKMKLLRQIILGILMHEDLKACLAVFERITQSDQLQNFREALRLFITQFVVKNAKKGLIPEDKASMIKERVDLVERILTTPNSRTIF